MMMYTLYNGPAILAVSDDMAEIIKIRDSYPALIKPFLSIGEKGIGCTIKLHSQDLERKDIPPPDRPADKMYLPPIDRPGEEFETEEDPLYCLACGEHINDAGKVKYLNIETHGFDGWDSSLPQPRTSSMCWDCASEFKRQIQGREWKIIDFMEEGKKK